MEEIIRNSAALLTAVVRERELLERLPTNHG